MKQLKVLVPDNYEGNICTIDDDAFGETSYDLAPVVEPEYRKILDYGFVGLVDYMGDDMSIVNAARVSYGKGTKKVNTDEGLVRYLMRHLHTTPFEMVEFKWHIKAPIFVFRQWHRHRTFSINEYSARYSVLDGEMYMATQENMKPQSSNNRQGRSADILNEEEYTAVCSVVDHIFEESYQAYKYLLGPNEETGTMPPAPDAIQQRITWCQDAALKGVREARKLALENETENPYPTEESVEGLIRGYYAQNGVAVLDDDFPGLARELARKVLPVATYSQMYWKGNLHNLFHFLNLRCDPHAQHEIKVYADAMLEMIEPIVPWAVRAFRDYRLEALNMSRMEIEAIKNIFTRQVANGIDVVSELDMLMSDMGCSKREIREFVSKII